MNKIQCILFDASIYNYYDCIKWMLLHNYFRFRNYIITNRYYRFKLIEPDENKYNYKLENQNNGISFIIQYSK